MLHFSPSVKAHKLLHFIYLRQRSYLRRVQPEAVALVLRILDSQIKDDSPDLPWHCVLCLFQINLSFWDWAECKLICRRYTHAKRSAWLLSRLSSVYLLVVGTTFVQPLDKFGNVSVIFNVKLLFYIFYRKPDHSHNAVVRSYRFLGCTRCLLGQNNLSTVLSICLFSSSWWISLVWSPWEVIEHLSSFTSRCGMSNMPKFIRVWCLYEQKLHFQGDISAAVFWIHLCELKRELSGC